MILIWLPWLLLSALPAKAQVFSWKLTCLILSHLWKTKLHLLVASIQSFWCYEPCLVCRRVSALTIQLKSRNLHRRITNWGFSDEFHLSLSSLSVLQIQVSYPDTVANVKCVVRTTVGSTNNHNNSQTVKKKKRVLVLKGRKRLYDRCPFLLHSATRLPKTLARWPAVEHKLCRVKRCGCLPQLLTRRRILPPSVSLSLDLVRQFFCVVFLKHPFQNDLGCSLKICNVALKCHDEKCHSTFVDSTKIAQEIAMTTKTSQEKKVHFACWSFASCRANEDFAIIEMKLVC